MELANLPSWVVQHAFVLWVGHMLVMLIVGCIPPLPPNAGFWARWAYGILKAVALNARGVSNVLGFKVPQLQLSRKTEKEPEDA